MSACMHSYMNLFTHVYTYIYVMYICMYTRLNLDMLMSMDINYVSVGINICIHVLYVNDE
jgi:hypothetical protein